MAIREKFGSAGKTADRIGGKLFFRTLGIVVLIPLLIALWGFVTAMQSGDVAGMAVTGAAVALFGFLAKYMFSPNRRLTDIDE